MNETDIATYFEAAKRNVYRPSELHRLFREKRREWRLAHASGDELANAIGAKTMLRRVVLTSEHYQPETRFVWKAATIYELALSLKPKSYLSHGTAVFLHGLDEIAGDSVYVNHEQSAKPASSCRLSQEGIDRAFSSPQRQSRYSFSHGTSRILVINGKNTGRLGLCDIAGPDGKILSSTNIERTLIDIAVRPSYAGNVESVLKAYKNAKGRFSVTELVTLLNKLDYLYPYHQVIGFYMECARYDASDLQQLEALRMEVDFYATYGLMDPEYSQRWRLFYPREIQI